MKSLDFMIIGAQKSGTTALSHFLSQHPNLRMAQGKEVHLFDAEDFCEEWNPKEINERYAKHFVGADETAKWGEATPIYLYWSRIIPALKRYNPALKLIVILRDPTERAISHYEMEKSRGNEVLPLWRALWCEKRRLSQEGDRLGHSHRCHSYVDRGRYASQLEQLRKYFNDDQILVLENEELQQEHELTLDKVCQFLGVPHSKEIKPERVFSGEYRMRPWSPYYGFLKFLLRCRFRQDNAKLKTILKEMGISADWHWLT